MKAKAKDVGPLLPLYFQLGLNYKFGQKTN